MLFCTGLEYQFHFFPTREISWYVHNLIFSYFLPNCNIETVYVIVLTSKEYEMDTAWIYVVYLRFRATLNYSSSGHIHLHNFFFSTFSMKIFMVDEYQLYVEVEYYRGFSQNSVSNSVVDIVIFRITLLKFRYVVQYLVPKIFLLEKNALSRSLYLSMYISV